MRGRWALAAALALVAQPAAARDLDAAQRHRLLRAEIRQSDAALFAKRDAEMRANTQALMRAQPQTLSRFEAALAAQPSATKALEGWCAARHFADPAPASVTAQRFYYPGERLIPAGLHTMLAIGANERIAIRHVNLNCVNAQLSEAHNWYVPSRLTPAMNAALGGTDIPFGTVAAPLHFTRQPLSSQRGAGEGCPASTIVTHRALLRLPNGAPLAYVLECYTSANLAPPVPVPPPMNIP